MDHSAGTPGASAVPWPVGEFTPTGSHDRTGATIASVTDFALGRERTPQHPLSGKSPYVLVTGIYEFDFGVWPPPDPPPFYPRADMNSAQRRKYERYLLKKWGAKVRMVRALARLKGQLVDSELSIASEYEHTEQETRKALRPSALRSPAQVPRTRRLF